MAVSLVGPVQLLHHVRDVTVVPSGPTVGSRPKRTRSTRRWFVGSARDVERAPMRLDIRQTWGPSSSRPVAG
jgi:hypothetical protein